jgi:hypothetical protein
MGIAISEDHLELTGVADAFLERTGARAEARLLLDAPEETLPAYAHLRALVVRGDLEESEGEPTRWKLVEHE